MKRQLITILMCVAVGVCIGQQLADDADKNEFERQLLGEWVKCASDNPHRGVTNGAFLVEAINFMTNGVVEWNETAFNKTGRYSVEFERPPGHGAVTLARINLTTADGHSNTLTRVNFGNDSRFVQGELFLRIEGPAVYQVFRRKNRQQEVPANGTQSTRAETSRTSSETGSRH